MNQYKFKETAGLQTLRVCGTIHHNIGSIFPAVRTVVDSNTGICVEQPRAPPTNLQIFFYDGDIMNCRNIRDQRHNERQLLKARLQDLKDHNQFYNKIKLQIEAHFGSFGFQIAVYDRMKPLSAHQRTYNAPAVIEAALLIDGSGELEDAGKQHCVMINSREPIDGHRKPHNVYSTQSCYDTLSYVITHCRGDAGWSPNSIPLYKRHKTSPHIAFLLSTTSFRPNTAGGYAGNNHERSFADEPETTGVHFEDEEAADVMMMQENVNDAVLIDGVAEEGGSSRQSTTRRGKFCTAMDFSSYRLQVREVWPAANERPRVMKDTLLYGGNIFLQFILDQYLKIEEQRLSFISRNQSKLKAELYSGLQDAVAADEASKAGHYVILPSTFIGSPRHNLQVTKIPWH